MESKLQSALKELKSGIQQINQEGARRKTKKSLKKKVGGLENLGDGELSLEDSPVRASDQSPLA
jgi:hypothetical protein